MINKFSTSCDTQHSSSETAIIDQEPTTWMTSLELWKLQMTFSQSIDLKPGIASSQASSYNDKISSGIRLNIPSWNWDWFSRPAEWSERWSKSWRREAIISSTPFMFWSLRHYESVDQWSALVLFKTWSCQLLYSFLRISSWSVSSVKKAKQRRRLFCT